MKSGTKGNMKIGILTHHYINNFGALLQTYALQSAAESLFPDAQVCVIDYVNVKHALINTLGWYRFDPRRESVRGYAQKIRLPQTFARARRQMLKLTPRVRSAKQINALGLDCIIVGSDEVWNYADTKSIAPVKFGVGLTCKRLISYAPSVGQAGAQGKIPAMVREGVGRFSALSARDDMTQRLLERMGHTPARVLDPTFLVPLEAQSVSVRKPYILFYYCEHMPERMREDITRYARENGLALYGAGECGRQYESDTVNLTPAQWIGMFREAAFVVTGTFHGVVFSILSARQFACYMTNSSRAQKVQSLLHELGLEGRQMTQDTRILPLITENKIDYAALDELLRVRIEQSRAYLERSVRGDGQ